MPKPFECVSGNYTGDATGFAINLGFKPNMVIAFNVTDGDTLCGMINGMTAATGFAIVSSVAAIGSEGITFSDTGFSLGTSAVCNENNKVYRYVAVGGN